MAASAVALALVNELGPDELATLASRLAPYLPTAPPPAEDGWLDSKAAATYLGISRNALHKLTAARAIPFEQDAAGCKCWFRRVDLDHWRQGCHSEERQQKRSPRRVNARGPGPRRGVLHEQS